MNDVAGQDDEARILDMDKQRLAAWGVPWRGNQSDAPVAKHIGITVDELKVLRGAQELTRQCHQLIYVVVRPVAGIYPAILSLLHQDCGVGEQAHVAEYASASSNSAPPPNFAERMKQTSQAEQPKVPPTARLPPKPTTRPAPANPLTSKDVRSQRLAEHAERRPTKIPAGQIRGWRAP